MPWSKDPLKQGKQGRPRKQRGAAIDRPSKYTKELADKICAAVRLGVTLEVAAASVKIHKQTVQNWINAGLSGSKSEDLVDFAASVEQARALFQIDNLLVIEKCAKGTKDRPPNWLPSAWKLERCVQERYAIQKHTLEVRDTTIKDLAIAAAEDQALKSITDQIQADAIDHQIVDVEVEEGYNDEQDDQE